MRAPLRTFGLAATLFALSLAFGLRSASAGPPIPFNSYVAPRLVSCPAGDSTFVVIVRDIAGNPWLDACCVEVHLCGCGGYRLSQAGTHPYTVDASGCVAYAQQNLQGYALFPFAGGGLCPGDTVFVVADGIVLRQVLAVASFDQNGDLAVTQADVAIVQSKVGTADPSADFDGDGMVTAADVALVQAHLGHAAPDAVTGVAPPGPYRLSLSAPGPNPFTQETRFTLTLDRAARVRVMLVDLAGRSVARTFDGELDAGPHAFSWAGRRDDGSVAPSGVYFLQADVAGRRLDRRTVFLGGR